MNDPVGVICVLGIIGMMVWFVYEQYTGPDTDPTHSQWYHNIGPGSWGPKKNRSDR